jgi:SAM-dependent methyltransferase
MTSRKTRAGWRSARTSDRHELYELSVQDADGEVAFIDQIWRERRSRQPRSIREDFCGTAQVCAAWVRRRKANVAVGVDLDAAVLDWGRSRLAQRLDSEQLSRVELAEGDVRTAKTAPVDTLLAMNFSSFTFKTRAEMRLYFQAARANLVRDGIFILDAYGGSESFSEMEEERDLDGFTYVWDQHHYNPITGDALNHIHFRFPDGSEMTRAFTYDWRLWTLPELQELLLEAGFRSAVVYWEGTDRKTGEGNGRWRATRKGEACAGWIAYLVADK